MATSPANVKMALASSGNGTKDDSDNTRGRTGITTATACEGESVVLEEVTREAMRYCRLYNQHDTKGIGEMVTDDCLFLFPGRPAIRGREEVIQYFAGVFEKGVASGYKVEVCEVGPPGATDLAYEKSYYSMYYKNGSVLSQGKHLVIWKRVNEKWLMYRNMFTWNHLQGVNVEQKLLADLSVLNLELMAAWKKQDRKKLSSLFTRDAQVLPPGRDPVDGMEELLEYFGAFPWPPGVEDVSMETMEAKFLNPRGDMAYAWATYRYAATPSPATGPSSSTSTVSVEKGGQPLCASASASGDDQGKFLLVYKKVCGSWKIYLDMMNSDFSYLPPLTHNTVHVTA